MVGFALAHGAANVFLLGLLFLPFGFLFAGAMLLFGLFKKLRFNANEWLLLSGLLLVVSLLAFPYPAWERLDMMACSAGPLGDAYLREAARMGDLDEVMKLVAQGHNVNDASSDGETPLGSAARGRNTEVVRFLLAHGADVNHQNLAGETPLMLAAGSGDSGVVKLLLEYGADPCRTMKYPENENAQRIAEKRHNAAAVEYLAAHSHCAPLPPIPTNCPNGSTASCVEVH
jgi:Ankyrin repeats (3 copies)